MIAPTLLVGLGGTGSKIVLRVSKMVSEEERRNIAFAVLDTDVNEQREIKDKAPFIKTIQTSTKQTVGEYLRTDVHSRDKWFPVNAILNSKALTEGAGQVRSVSRLAFESCLRAGKLEPLHEAIQSLYKVDENQGEQALRVVIVSSLAGGTGSGLILPVGLYIRNYLKTNFRSSANITRGFFILPEVFDEVIRGQAERNNLKANAYATLRELDAFLMKGDATLADRYKDSVKMEFPRVSSNEYEEYDVSPFDFCFLFDAQNSSGGKLNSFNQYIDHAANCIYAQSIGPMNKRSNSSEDNTIRKLAKERGRNRYAGAGTAMLIYPTADIKTFIGLSWAKETISSSWMVFDNMYKDLCKSNAKRRAAGQSAPNRDPYEYYIETVDQKASEMPLAKHIVRSCNLFDDTGLAVQGKHKWDEYFINFDKKILADKEHTSENINYEKSSASNKVLALSDEIENFTGNFVEAYKAIMRLKKLVNNYIDEVVPTIVYNIFTYDNDDITKAPADYQLEKYLVDNENQFLHPNAIRYFLSHVLIELKTRRIQKDLVLRGQIEYIENFEKNNFLVESTGGGKDDEGDGGQVVTSPDAYANSLKNTGIQKLTKSLSDEQSVAQSSLLELIDKINAYGDESLLSRVYDAAIEYVEKHLAAFDVFYSSFKDKVSSIDKRIDTLYRKYDNTRGMTARYVCASSKCLDRFRQEMPYTGNESAISPVLAKEIYNKVHVYAMMEKKPYEKYFGSLFDKGIIGFFEDSVMKNCGEYIDIDIITALEREFIFEHAEENLNESFSESDIETYVRHSINDTRLLSCPYIDNPLGEAPEKIDSCAFNPSITPNDESSRARLVDKELRNYGGVMDEDIGKNMILFYQSFYGLRATDLSKFAPPEKSLTYKRDGGSYFKAYFDMISRIHPVPTRSREINPHIDRWWHIITKMPDLDDDNQAKQEQEIYGAFFWGLIFRYISLYNVSNGSKVYIADMDTLKLTDSELTISNGTQCDKLYEVLDAIAIYPELAAKIMQKTREVVRRELDLNDSITECEVYRLLKNVEITEPGLGANDEPAKSIFDLPMLMKKSASTDLYYEEDVINILKAEIQQVRWYLENFFDSNDIAKAMGELLDHHFDQYIVDIQIESKSSPNIFKETLFGRTINIIAGAYDDLGLHKRAYEIKAKGEELKKG